MVVNIRYIVSITLSRLKASVKNGDLVEDAGGSLLISYHYVPLSYTDDLKHQQIHQTLAVPEQVAPLDLSSVHGIKLEIKEEAVAGDGKDQDSGYNPSPPLVDLTSTPDGDEDRSQLVSYLTSPELHNHYCVDIRLPR